MAEERQEGEEFFSGGRFSSAGAIVGCTYPAAAAAIRNAMPRAPIVVVGYGAQAGMLAGCTACFTDRNDGAIVNASRSLTYAQSHEPASEEELAATIRAPQSEWVTISPTGWQDERLPHPHRKTTDHGTLRTG